MRMKEGALSLHNAVGVEYTNALVCSGYASREGVCKAIAVMFCVVLRNA